MSEIITDEKFDALIKNALHEAADCMDISNNLKVKLSQHNRLNCPNRQRRFINEGAGMDLQSCVWK